MTRMYALAKTWNPFKGCLFDCIYCEPSFKRICRLYNKCPTCKQYLPHEHPERLDRVPKAKIIFVAGNGDISFCRPEFVLRIIKTIRRYPDRTFYLQSKNPICLERYVDILPKNVILLTTLETNRDEGYDKISKAPKPSSRFIDFLLLKYPRKVVTIEPVMDFDEDIFFDWIIRINPEYVWIGYNSKPKDVQLPEPSLEKLRNFIIRLKKAGIEVRGKELRGMKIGMRILVCGDRNWEDWGAILNFIKPLPKDTVIIHGKCKGVDKMTDWVAKKFGLEVIPFPADWEKYGKGAGPIRNKQMIVEGKPDLVVAFHNDISKSKGTKNMIKQAREHGIEVRMMRSNG